MNKNRFFKKITGLVLGIVFALQISVSPAYAEDYWPEAMNTASPSAIVMEMSTGTVLYEKNSTEKMYPASITKIMTVMIALENSSLDEMVYFTDASIDNTEGSGLREIMGKK